MIIYSFVHLVLLSAPVQTITDKHLKPYYVCDNISTTPGDKFVFKDGVKIGVVFHSELQALIYWSFQHEKV